MQLFPPEDLPSFASTRALFANMALALLVGGLAGCGGAFFLFTLDAATELRFQHLWLVLLLPVGGVFAAWVYRLVGKGSEKGNNLIIEEIHNPGGGVPMRMTPLVIGATLLTHLTGGSAGREGTAVQMGGALAAAVQKILRLGKERQAMILSAGVAGGFGAVFGTPLAGAIFALEVLVRGRITYGWFGPCLISAMVGNYVCLLWGVEHENLRAIANLSQIPGGLDPHMLGMAAVLGLICALCSRLFIGVTHGFTSLLDRFAPKWWQRPLVGGLLIIVLALALQTDAYLGLSASHPNPAEVSLMTLFQEGGATPWSWWWKLVFTAVTLGAGFKGGEVTPLFFIGAALGHVVGPLLGLPIALAAALGFVAVFAGASKTPLASTLLAIEIFGGGHVDVFAVACVVSYLASGMGGIYSAQRTEDDAAAKI